MPSSAILDGCIPQYMSSEDGQVLTCAAPPHSEPHSDSCESVPVRVTLNGDNPPDATKGPARSQPCCVPSVGDTFPEDVLFTYYDSQDREETGLSTPNGATLTADPSDWTGDDMP